MDETSGTRYDSHGTNNLTANGTVSYDAGKIGNAAKFVGTAGRYLSIIDNASLSAGDVDFTVAGWVYPTDLSSSRTIVNKTKDSSSGEYRLYFDAT